MTDPPQWPLSASVSVYCPYCREESPLLHTAGQVCDWKQEHLELHAAGTGAKGDHDG